MIDDIVLNKMESIEHCIKQVETYYALPRDLPFEHDHLMQDAIAANLQRACDICIDLANHTVMTRKLGLLKESRESFRLLARYGILPGELADNLEGMVGFHNTLVHQDQDIDIGLMTEVIEQHLGDLIDFTNLIVKEFSAGVD